MKNRYNKILAALAVAFASVGAFAADGDLQIPTTSLTSIVNGVKTWLTSAVDIILPVLGAVLVYYFARWAWQVIKSFTRSGR